MRVLKKWENGTGRWLSARNLIFFLALCCLVFPYHAGTTEQAKGLCLKPYIKTIFPWVARPGELVKIQGERFGIQRGEVIFTEKGGFPLNLVFGSDVKAEIVNWTEHRIWVICPEDAATGPVVVKIPCGAESNQYAFEVSKSNKKED
jgi:hypothetical protein